MWFQRPGASPITLPFWSLVLAVSTAGEAPGQVFGSPRAFLSAGESFHTADVNGDFYQDILALRGSELIVTLGSERGLLAPYVIDTGIAGSFAIADLDGDGQQDVLVLGSPLGRGRLLRGDGRGGFRMDPPFPASASIAGANDELVLLDVSRDGDLDVVQFQTLYTNDGTGRFTVQAQAAIAPWGVGGVGDFDGDGDTDLVSRDLIATAPVRIATQTAGTFTWTASLAYPGVLLRGPFVRDVDQDGVLDVLVTGSAGLGIAYGSPAGFLPFALRTVATLDGPFASADFDGNGLQDLAFATANGPTQVLHQVMPRTFFAVTAYANQLSQGGSRLLARDLDQDGFPDLIGQGITGTELVVARGLGNFTFELETHAALHAMRSFTLADIDRDGDLDALSSAPRSGAVGFTELFPGLTDPSLTLIGMSTPGPSGIAPGVQTPGGLPRRGNTRFEILFDKLAPGRTVFLLGSQVTGQMPLGRGFLYALPPYDLALVQSSGGQLSLPGSGSAHLPLPIPAALTFPLPDLYFQACLVDPLTQSISPTVALRVRLIP